AVGARRAIEAALPGAARRPADGIDLRRRGPLHDRRLFRPRDGVAILVLFDDPVAAFVLRDRVELRASHGAERREQRERTQRSHKPSCRVGEPTWRDAPRWIAARTQNSRSPRFFFGGAAGVTVSLARSIEIVSLFDADTSFSSHL